MLNVKLKDIELGTPSDGDIYFNTDTGKYSVWYKNKYYGISEGKNSRQVLYHRDDGSIWNFYFSDGYRCSCGCNVYHYEYDGKKIYSVCNACGEIVGVVKSERAEELLSKGIWK